MSSPHIVSPKNTPPGPSTSGLRQRRQVNNDFVGFMESCAERYGEIFTIRPYPNKAFVIATGPKEIKEILFDRERFAGGSTNSLIAPVVGERSVILASGSEHMRKRKLLLAPFHGEQVARWSNRIEDIAARHLDALPVGEPIRLRPVMQRITFNVICQVVFGMDDPSKVAEFNSAIIRLYDKRLAALLPFRFMFRRGGRFHPSRLYFSRRDPVDQLICQEIARHRADPDAASRDDVLSLLIAAHDEDGRPLQDDELRDELLGLLSAGHETTATALAWAGERLSRNPTIQKRLITELENGDDDDYLKALIDETMRSRPPLIDGIRVAREDTQLGDYLIPAGTRVAAMFSITHRRADLWESPLEFRPERFLTDKPAPYTFAPFGGGIRRCIGAPLATSELRIVLQALVRRFTLEPAPIAEERMKLTGPTLAPSAGGQVVLYPAPCALANSPTPRPLQRARHHAH